MSWIEVDIWIVREVFSLFHLPEDVVVQCIMPFYLPLRNEVLEGLLIDEICAKKDQKERCEHLLFLPKHPYLRFDPRIRAGKHVEKFVSRVYWDFGRQIGKNYILRFRLLLEKAMLLGCGLALKVLVDEGILRCDKNVETYLTQLYDPCLQRGNVEKRLVFGVAMYLGLDDLVLEWMRKWKKNQECYKHVVLGLYGPGADELDAYYHRMYQRLEEEEERFIQMSSTSGI